MTNDHQAIVNGRDIPVSTKHVIEIANVIKGRSLEQSRLFLQRIIDKKQAVPFRHFKRNVGHKPGNMAAGRYPRKASKEILALLDSLEANAANKGLESQALYLVTIIPNRASRPWRPGRKGRVKMKRTHLTIIAEERVKEAGHSDQKKTEGVQKK